MRRGYGPSCRRPKSPANTALPSRREAGRVAGHRCRRQISRFPLLPSARREGPRRTTISLRLSGVKAISEPHRAWKYLSLAFFRSKSSPSSAPQAASHLPSGEKAASAGCAAESSTTATPLCLQGEASATGTSPVLLSATSRRAKRSPDRPNRFAARCATALHRPPRQTMVASRGKGQSRQRVRQTVVDSSDILPRFGYLEKGSAAPSLTSRHSEPT